MTDTKTTLEQFQDEAAQKVSGVYCIGEKTTASRGVVRLEEWDYNKYVLWYHGQVVWKSW